jgi:hypothetical protein
MWVCNTYYLCIHQLPMTHMLFQVIDEEYVLHQELPATLLLIELSSQKVKHLIFMNVRQPVVCCICMQVNNGVLITESFNIP